MREFTFLDKLALKNTLTFPSSLNVKYYSQLDIFMASGLKPNPVYTVLGETGTGTKLPSVRFHLLTFSLDGDFPFSSSSKTTLPCEPQE